MKKAEKRFCSFMQSCRASKILGGRWSQILDITKNVSWRNKTPIKTPKMRNRNRPKIFQVSSPHFYRYLKSETTLPQGFFTLYNFA